MNKNTCISVKTPVGLSDDQRIGEMFDQGMVEGAVMSAVNLDCGVADYFKDSEDELTYFVVRLRPLLFQDDALRISLDPAAAQSGNVRMGNVDVF